MLILDTGEYTYRLTKYPSSQIEANLVSIYGQHAINSHEGPVDFDIAIKQPAIVRRFYRPQVTFYSDQTAPFKPMPFNQAYPALEWGMNWCVAAYDFNRFIVHAAVLEKNGRAIMFPAAPGSGKSTLTAFLSQLGWNLYSDEMTIIDFNTNLVSPVYRPISLKNESIQLVKKWFPKGVFSDTAKSTQKGDVALFKGIDWETYQNLDKAELIGVVFPKYSPKEKLTIYSLTQLQGFEQLAKNAFNYNITGMSGFETIKKVIESSVQFEVHYNDLEELKDFLEQEVI